MRRWLTRRLLTTCALLLAATAVTAPAYALSLTEILYVTGCRDSEPRRHTAGCFTGAAAASEPVLLSLRGLNYPSAPVENLRVVLLESVPLVEMESDETAPHPTPRVRFVCADLQASPAFPTQLLRCSLTHPLSAPAPSADVLDMWRAAGGALWFDLVLQTRRADSGGEDDGYTDVAVLRRAVELDVAAALRGMGLRPARQPGAAAAAAVDLATHPLERLYARAPPKTGPGRGEAGGSDPVGEGDEDQLWVELGIGGLAKELRTLFRRVFLSRLPSLESLAESLDVQHVRGVILYGPPGNGKSLIARSLATLLGPEAVLTVVSAADVLSKFVGESEKNLRDAFGGYPIGTSAKAETDRRDGKVTSFFGTDEDEDEEGDDGESSDADPSSRARARKPKRLHVLVIDEFESLFRRRGHSEDESSAKAVYDGVTNTLLSLMDGIESRNDLLVIGLTNRLHSVDAALLRPGRFEVLIEVPAPSIPAREEIFFIHTARLREKGYLAADVSLMDLALRSGGFSGADIAGTVRAATSYALLRYRQAQAAREGGEAFSAHCGSAAAAGSSLAPPEAGACGSSSPTHTFEVTSADLTKAMEEIRDAKDERSSLSHLGDGEDTRATMVNYDGSLVQGALLVEETMARMVRSHRVRAATVSITGASGTGKSFAARHLTTVYAFATVRFLSCRRLVELRDREEQLKQVHDALRDASRGETGVVVLDDVDILLDSLSGHTVWEGALRSMLYEFHHGPRGVRRPLFGAKDPTQEALEVSGGGVLHGERNHRMLIVTATRADVLTEVEPDLRLRVRPIVRAALPLLLAHYNISSPRLSHSFSQIVSAYPPSVSFRNFLRLTDTALWSCVLAKEKNAGEEKSTPEPVARPLPRFFAQGTDTAGAAEGHFLRTQEDARSFALAVKSVATSMGLTDSFTGWYNSFPRQDLFIYMQELTDKIVETPSAPVTDSEAEEAAEEGIEVVW